MEQRWRRQATTQKKYIVSLGKSNRDTATIINAVSAIKSRVDLFIASKGNPVPNCMKKNGCNILHAMTREALDDFMSKALLIAVPLFWKARNRGITALSETVMLGKMLLLTDTGTGGGDEFLADGINGFLIPYRDVSGWIKAIRNVLSMNSSTLQDFERRAFDIAAAFTQ